MTTYTEEDFAKAKFATHPDGAWAGRTDPNDDQEWNTSWGDWVSDSDMAEHGWTPVATMPLDPWDALDIALQAAWDAGEERDGRPDERYIFTGHDGAMVSSVSAMRLDANHQYRLRPRPSWRSADVVRAHTKDDLRVRLFVAFRKDAHLLGWTDPYGSTYGTDKLIDPKPMTVTEKED